MLRRPLALLALCGALASGPGRADRSAQPPAIDDAKIAQNDANYAEPAHWLCWPGRDDACAADLATTVIESDGRSRIEPFQADPKAPVDCFYVYPTVSLDPGLNAEFAVKPELRAVAQLQAARLTSHCRVYAPVYRQQTVAALRARLVGRPMPGSDDPAQSDVGLADVRAAFAYYLAHENHGRGYVLVGHSQGAIVLARLIAADIDGKAAQARLVAAFLIGAPVLVPPGADAGGDFHSLPLCRRASQTGCVVSYVSFRDRLPPPQPPRAPYLGYSAVPDRVVACVNPAQPAGGRAVLKSYFAASGAVGGVTPATRWNWAKDLTVQTPYVSVPGLIRGECVSRDGASYLAISVVRDPDDARTPDIPGDLVRNGVVRAEWGLHLIDMGLAYGDLLDMIRAQSSAYAGVHR